MDGFGVFDQKVILSTNALLTIDGICAKINASQRWDHVSVKFKTEEAMNIMKTVILLALIGE